jgi:hypothetical protein
MLLKKTAEALGRLPQEIAVIIQPVDYSNKTQDCRSLLAMTAPPIFSAAGTKRYNNQVLLVSVSLTTSVCFPVDRKSVV